MKTVKKIIIIFLIIFPSLAIGLNWQIFLPQKRKDSTTKADRILIEKSKRKLSLYAGKDLIKTYKISLGFTPLGHKLIEGDGKTPEGDYTICYKNVNSQFHLSLKISYPNENDLKRAARLGKSPGCDIMIHGTPSGSLSVLSKVPLFNWFLKKQDWTLGCIAVSNAEIEEIYRVVTIGTNVSILP